ncbi:hypothetical protein PENTCL1PPCAC_22151, partial [Pristionchus entomophagus]
LSPKYRKSCVNHSLQSRMSTSCPVVISGPSGAGKSSILKMAMNKFRDDFVLTVSHTSRAPGEGERNGVHYWFSSKTEMDKMIEDGEFLEYASFGGNMYGTSRKAVQEMLDSGRICVLDVELNGVRSLKESLKNAIYIYVRAPHDQLEKRLRYRGTESDESLQKRLRHAREDMEESE